MNDYLKYLQEKRAEVLKKIKPICSATGLNNKCTSDWYVLERSIY